MQTLAGQPLASNPLVLLHGAPVLFLLVDQTLQDFHLITPTGTDQPGTLEFAFTNWLGQALVKRAFEDLQKAKSEREMQDIRDRIDRELATLRPPVAAR